VIKQLNNSVEIYGPNFSNFVRSVMLVCEENKIYYTTGLEINGEKIEYKSDAHYQLHPFGKFPVLVHDELILPETASICRYLQSIFDEDAEGDFSIQQLASIDAFSALISINIDKAIMRDYLLEFAFPKGENGMVRFDKINEAQPEVRKALKAVESELVSGQSLDNARLSLADILLAPMLHYLTTLPATYNLLNEFKLVNQYFNRLMKIPSFKKVLVIKEE
jgi:glutathione S-transferase